MIDNMTSRSVAPSITKPFFAAITHDDAIGLMDPTIFTGIIGQFLTVEILFILFLKLQFPQSACYTRYFTINVVIQLESRTAR